MVSQMISRAAISRHAVGCNAFHSPGSLLPKPARRVASQREHRRNLRLDREWRSQVRAVPENGAGSDKAEAGETDNDDPLLEAIQVVRMHVICQSSMPSALAAAY